MKDKNKAEEGELHFTVDFPALFKELMSPANIVNMGPGGVMGLSCVIRALNNIGIIAIENKQDDILRELANIGIIGGVEDINKTPR